MPQYRRVRLPGWTYFFTVVTHARQPLFADERARTCLHGVFERTREKQPFEIIALCLMPDHLHTIWRLPDNDADFSGRWRRIKLCFTHWYRRGGPRSKIQAPDSRLWQKRFWEHAIRSDDDLRRHIDYIHYNPVKHGLAKSPLDWPWSTFHRYVREGRYDARWGGKEKDMPDIGDGSE